MKLSTRPGWLLFAVVLVLASTRAAMAVVTCGSNVTTDDVLTGNLICPDDPAVTVTSATLDMAGFTITSTTGIGVVLEGTGAKLMNGSVDSCPMDCVSLEGTGKHKVSNVTATACSEAGFNIVTPGNKLSDTSAIANTRGYFITADDNSVTRGHATGSIHGVLVSSIGGSNNKFSQYAAYDNAVGLAFSGGSGNSVKRSVAFNSSSVGFQIAGTGAKVANCVAADSNNGFDVSGEGHKLSKNSALGGDIGFLIGGVEIKLTKNVANGTGSDGFQSVGDDNSFKQCVAAGAAGDGFDIGASAQRNVVNGCRAIGSALEGIRVQGQSTTIKGSTALGSTGVDVHDANASCDSNIWQDNLFRTETDPANCIQ